MRILFYYPSNKRSNQIETTLVELNKLGHEIILLSTSGRGELHESLENLGIRTQANSINKGSALIYYLKQIIYLIRFCRKEKVDLIFGNLQHANFIAIWAQYFVKAKLVAFRHHFKFSGKELGLMLEINSTEKLFDRWINRLAPKIVLPSHSIRENILKTEKVSADKLEVIPYLYNFSAFSMPSDEDVSKIREKYPAKLRLIMVSRLIPFKRHRLVFPVFKKLIKEGFDLNVLVLDDGPEKDYLQKYIDENQLDKHIHLLSYQKNPLAFIKASDLLVHPSLTEASSNVAKEAGLLEVPIAACKEVGDFQEYLLDRVNGFYLDLAKADRSLEEIIKSIYEDKTILKELGTKLKNSIQDVFGGNQIAIQKYKELIGEYS